MMRLYGFMILGCLICAGCASSPDLFPEYSMQVDQAKLMRLYRVCIEKYYGDPDAIAKNCEPIAAPLRVRGLELKE
jgi:hypothetical protein